MQITRKSDATYVEKPGGTNVWYYLFDEYEVHYNEIEPGVTQDWHCHDTIEEVIYILSGQMLAEWIEDGERRSQTLHEGDLVQSKTSIHTFTNTNDDITKFIVIKLVLDGKNKREIFKTDKRSFSVDDLPIG